MTASSIHDRLYALKLRVRESFLQQLPQRLHQGRALWAQLTPGTRAREALERLHLLLHTIKGSGASFDFVPVAEVAQTGERVLRTVLDRDAVVDEPLLQELDRCLSGLEQLAPTLHGRARPAAPSFAVSAAVAPAELPEHDRRLIYLCDDDAELVQQLSIQLGCFGYQIVPFITLNDLRCAVLSKPPAVVIMDIMFPEGENAGPETLAAINRQLEKPVPSIFMSSRNDFAARLQSVKAGGSAYCPKPINPSELVEFLDHLTDRTPPEPFHVLVVDDDVDVALFHAMALEAAGMVARVASEPSTVLEMLEHFRADLVLVDLYMPDCSGPELASVLRQIPGYISLPIIYVSSETDLLRQFDALRVGADGFLVKPIAPERLVEEVRLRAERMRTLRSLMIRDSLTGLFNHNTILQFLEVAVATARRQGGTLCFAMLDIDRFKQVNDIYGHAAGDQVLMALSRTLRLRLRESDLIGRYGGEEFAVVLHDTDLDTACQVLDQLRASFATLSFFAEGREFRCTFSAGVATFPTCEDTRQLSEAADRALYRAKREGRNRIAAACPEDLESFAFLHQEV